MEPDQQLALSATAAVAAIAAGDLTAMAYTTTLLDRAEQLTDLRAVITLNREGALASAARIDDARRSGTALGRLAGLPVIVKDNINTKDLPTTAGTPASARLPPHRGRGRAPAAAGRGRDRPRQSQHARARLRHHEHQLRPVRRNRPNPYDPSRIPGGSSGGTAAAIAARIVPAGLGSDTGGSVRIPAAFNGIAGLRPSTGGSRHRYSGTGVLPLSHTLDTVGPMARTVADVALLDSVVTGAPVPAPAATRRPAGRRPGGVVERARSVEVDAVVQDAKQRLADAGCGIRRRRHAGDPGAVREDHLPGRVARADRRHRRVPGETVARPESPWSPSSTRSPARM